MSTVELEEQRQPAPDNDDQPQAEAVQRRYILVNFADASSPSQANSAHVTGQLQKLALSVFSAAAVACPGLAMRLGPHIELIREKEPLRSKYMESVPSGARDLWARRRACTMYAAEPEWTGRGNQALVCPILCDTSGDAWQQLRDLGEADKLHCTLVHGGGRFTDEQRTALHAHAMRMFNRVAKPMAAQQSGLSSLSKQLAASGQDIGSSALVAQAEESRRMPRQGLRVNLRVIANGCVLVDFDFASQRNVSASLTVHDWEAGVRFFSVPAVCKVADASNAGVREVRLRDKIAGCAVDSCNVALGAPHERVVPASPILTTHTTSTADRVRRLNLCASRLLGDCSNAKLPPLMAIVEAMVLATEPEVLRSSVVMATDTVKTCPSIPTVMVTRGSAETAEGLPVLPGGPGSGSVWYGSSSLQPLKGSKAGSLCILRVSISGVAMKGVLFMPGWALCDSETRTSKSVGFCHDDWWPQVAVMWPTHSTILLRGIESALGIDNTVLAAHKTDERYLISRYSQINRALSTLRTTAIGSCNNCGSCHACQLPASTCDPPGDANANDDNED
jgi:hypothetical protein